MTNFARIILATTILIEISECIKVFDETAWMDDKGRDKFFEYSDLTEPVTLDAQNYSNNVDFELFEGKSKVQNAFFKNSQGSIDR